MEFDTPDTFYIVNPEDIFSADSLDDAEPSITGDDLIDDTSVTEEDKHFGIYGLLVDAIQSKWENINTYKSYIATLNQEDLKEKQVLDTLNNVLEKELEIVSTLQDCLANFDDQAGEIL